MRHWDIASFCGYGAKWFVWIPKKKNYTFLIKTREKNEYHGRSFIYSGRDETVSFEIEAKYSESIKTSCLHIYTWLKDKFVRDTALSNIESEKEFLILSLNQIININEILMSNCVPNVFVSFLLGIRERSKIAAEFSTF